MTSDSISISKTKHCLIELGVSPDFIEARGLPFYEDASALTVAEIDAGGREHRLTPETAAAWSRMKAEAQQAGVILQLISAFRSFERQREIIAQKIQAGQSPAAIFAVSAPPGCSEHHTGRAIDIGTPDSRPLELEFESTAAYRWLKANAAAHGFTLSFPPDNRWGYAYEPWHWLHR